MSLEPHGEPMLEEFAANTLLMLLCYGYVLVVIFMSSRIEKLFDISRKSSRKFLHAMIGNLPFVIPFFTIGFFPFFVAAPFVLVTILASPYTPFKGVRGKLKGLSEISSEGHPLGLVFYAISYSVLALFSASRAYVVAAGVLPMAYGDSLASLVGERYGRRKYRLMANKSLEGSLAMFLGSFLSFFLSLFFFSAFYQFSLAAQVVPAIAVALIATVAEGLSPMGFDNLAVPVLSVLAFLFSGGGL